MKKISKEEQARRDAISHHDQMADAQSQCVPCKLCGGEARISDAGTGAGYYIRCSNARTYRQGSGCMIRENRLGGWAYNVMDWWNRLHATPSIGEVEKLREALEREAVLRAKPLDRNAARDIFRRKLASVEGYLGSDIAQIIDNHDAAEEHDANGVVYAVIEAMIDFAVETSIEEFASLVAERDRALSAAPPVEGLTSGEGDVFVVALALSKANAGSTTYSMSLTWRKGGTEQEAIDAAILYAANEKPGFGVWEKLVTRIPAASPATHAGSVREAAQALLDFIGDKDMRVYSTDRAVRDLRAALHPVDSRAQGDRQ